MSILDNGAEAFCGAKGKHPSTVLTVKIQIGKLKGTLKVDEAWIGYMLTSARAWAEEEHMEELEIYGR